MYIMESNKSRPVYDSAEDFLGALQEFRTQSVKEKEFWVFRGHWCSVWPLQASSRRTVISDDWRYCVNRLLSDPKAPGLYPQTADIWPNDVSDADKLLALWMKRDINSKLIHLKMNELNWKTLEFGDKRAKVKAFYKLHCAAELFAVQEFAELSDKIGLPILDGDKLAKPMQAFYNQRGIPSPSRITALAQHHNVPTRLLDWTRKPLVASLFATEDPGGLPGDDDKTLCIWALNISKVSPDRISYSEEPPVIRKLTCPHYLHSYLHAQDGLFTWCDDETELDYLTEYHDWLTLKECLGDTYGTFESDKYPLQQFKLRRSHVSDLRAILMETYGITRAHMMPTYDTVGRTIKMLWHQEN